MLLDLLNSRHSKINLVFGLVSLNCRLRLLEYSHSLKKKQLFFTFPFTFVFHLQPVTQNIILFLKTFRHFKMQKEKLCGDDVNRVCPLIDHRREPIKMRG